MTLFVRFGRNKIANVPSDNALYVNNVRTFGFSLLPSPTLIAELTTGARVTLSNVRYFDDCNA